MISVDLPMTGDSLAPECELGKTVQAMSAVETVPSTEEYTKSGLLVFGLATT